MTKKTCLWGIRILVVLLGAVIPSKALASDWDADPLLEAARVGAERVKAWFDQEENTRVRKSGKLAVGELQGSINTYLRDDTSLAGWITEIKIEEQTSAARLRDRTDRGITTVKVTASEVDPADGEVAQRSVEMTLAEIPYPLLTGPLHSCRGLKTSGKFPAHWGGITAVGDIEVDPRTMDRRWNSSIPRANPNQWVYLGLPWRNSLSYSQDMGSGAGTEIEDPWLSVRTLGVITDAPNTDPQPWPTDYVLGLATYDPDTDHSNLIQFDAGVSCPSVPYEPWKSISQQTGHYLTWVAADRFEEGGIIKTFQEWTHDQVGLWFFDTRNALEPDGTNLTPGIRVQGPWFTKGFIYLHAKSLQSKAAKGRDIAMVPPGEPFMDIFTGGAGYAGVYNVEPFVDGVVVNGFWDPGEIFTDTIPPANGGTDGVYDAEPWVNLNYDTQIGSRGSPPRHRVVALPGTETASLTLGGQTTTRTTTNARDAEGLPVQHEVNLYGLLYTAGTFSLPGSASVFGSVIAGGGMGEDQRGPRSGGKTSIYFDARLSRGTWPPPELELPLTFITGWEEF